MAELFTIDTLPPAAGRNADSSAPNRARAPVRGARGLDWMRAAPARPGLTVIDVEGVRVGRVVAVALAADGEVERYDVSLELSIGRGRVVMLDASCARFADGRLVALMHRRQFAALSEVRPGAGH